MNYPLTRSDHVQKYMLRAVRRCLARLLLPNCDKALCTPAFLYFPPTWDSRSSRSLSLSPASLFPPRLFLILPRWPAPDWPAR